LRPTGDSAVDAKSPVAHSTGESHKNHGNSWDDWDDWIKNQIDSKIRYLGIGIIGILEYLNTYSN